MTQEKWHKAKAPAGQDVLCCCTDGHHLDVTEFMTPADANALEKALGNDVSAQASGRWVPSDRYENQGWCVTRNGHQIGVRTEGEALYLARVLNERDDLEAALERAQADVARWRRNWQFETERTEADDAELTALRAELQKAREERDTAALNANLMRPVVDRALREDVFYKLEQAEAALTEARHYVQLYTMSADGAAKEKAQQWLTNNPK